MSSRSKSMGQIVGEIRRISRKMTQATLAEKSGRGLQTIQNIESGRRGMSDDCMGDIASALNVPICFFQLLSDDSSDPLVQQLQRLARKSIGLPVTEPPDTVAKKRGKQSLKETSLA